VYDVGQYEKEENVKKKSGKKKHKEYNPAEDAELTAMEALLDELKRKKRSRKHNKKRATEDDSYWKDEEGSGS
ncbi:hypothetical protein PMAYCL1PPCAC_20569, partial [Pristionchus mayeri]